VERIIFTPEGAGSRARVGEGALAGLARATWSRTISGYFLYFFNFFPTCGSRKSEKNANLRQLGCDVPQVEKKMIVYDLTHFHQSPYFFF